MTTMIESILAMKPSEYRNIKDTIKWTKAILRAKGNEVGATFGANKNANGSHAFFLDQSNIKYWCKYDTSNFQTFGREFREFNNTVGETINKDIIDDLKDTDIIIIGKPTAIYSVVVKKIRDFGRDRLNEKDNDKQTLSFPVSLLERFDID